MDKTIDVKISKIKSSFNTYEVNYYDSFTNATFSAIFENNVLGVIAINHFIKMIKSRFHEGNIIQAQHLYHIGSYHSCRLSGKNTGNCQSRQYRYLQPPKKISKR